MSYKPPTYYASDPPRGYLRAVPHHALRLKLCVSQGRLGLDFSTCGKGRSSRRRRRREDDEEGEEEQQETCRIPKRAIELRHRAQDNPQP